MQEITVFCVVAFDGMDNKGKRNYWYKKVIYSVSMVGGIDCVRSNNKPAFRVASFQQTSAWWRVVSVLAAETYILPNMRATGGDKGLHCRRHL